MTPTLRKPPEEVMQQRDMEAVAGDRIASTSYSAATLDRFFSEMS